MILIWTYRQHHLLLAMLNVTYQFKGIFCSENSLTLCKYCVYNVHMYLFHKIIYCCQSENRFHPALIFLNITGCTIWIRASTEFGFICPRWGYNKVFTAGAKWKPECDYGMVQWCLRIRVEYVHSWSHEIYLKLLKFSNIL